MKAFARVRALVFALSCVPILKLVWDAFTDGLEADPVKDITHRTGWWTLTFILLTLSVTPVRKLTGWNPVIKLRRMLGLFAFFYASLHFLTYAGLDQLFSFEYVGEDILKRPYITVGFTAFLLLIPLAVTSTKGWIRRLGKRWQKLHRLIYVSAVLGVVHFYWSVKADVREPLLFAALLALLLGFRVLTRRKAASPDRARPQRLEKVAGEG
jgi:sulfoxide reductase heme-binding subunit YedZ